MPKKNVLPLKWTALSILTLLTVLLVGCGSTPPMMLPPAQAQPQDSAGLHEGHTGQISFSGSQEPAQLDFEFVRQGQDLEGVGRIIISKDQDLDGVDINVGRLTGTDNGQTHSFSIDFDPPLWAGNLPG